MIEGVKIQELKQIKDERGKVMHMLRSDSALFNNFGEIYFSVVNPGVVKAWKKHLEMTQLLTVPVGEIKLVLHDDREDSQTKGRFYEVNLGENNYVLIKIPPRIWYGFQGVSSQPALIANCPDLPHDPNEVKRLEVVNSEIQYAWN